MYTGSQDLQEPALAVELGLVPVRERELAPVLALGQGLALGLAPVPGQEQEPGLVPHRQPSSRLTIMPAGLTIVSFSLVNSF